MLLIEELAVRAWPAREAVPVDGWLLRHTPALTRRRSNSALALGDGDARDLAPVMEFYAHRGRRASAGFERSHGYHYRVAPDA